jgi:filamin
MKFYLRLEFYLLYKILGPSKHPVTSRLVEEKNGEFRIEFMPSEVGSHLVEVSVAGQKLPAGPLVAKVYNSALIRVTDVGVGVVGQPCQFRGNRTYTRLNM